MLSIKEDELNNRPIPVNKPLLSGKEGEYLKECIDTGWISSEGPFVQRFESAFAEYTGKAYGVAVSSGSAALDVAVAALEIGPGDEVIIPTFTIISPALSILRSGAMPVLVDSDSRTWNMDVEQIEQRVTKKTRAIIAVHIYGLPVDLDPVLALCKKYDLYLIEDAAEVIGQTYGGKKCGSFGDISIFSFYPNKHITTGEGGMCLTDNEKLAYRCHKLRNLAFETNQRRFVHNEMGWNYRMTNLQAAVGLAQLENIENHLAIKRSIGTLYMSLLKSVRNMKLPLASTSFAENIFWVFGLVAKTASLKEKLVAHLNANKIGTRPFFWCMHEQPVFIKMGLFKKESHPSSENLARNGIYIPSGIGLSEEEARIVAGIILEFTNK